MNGGEKDNKHVFIRPNGDTAEVKYFDEGELVRLDKYGYFQEEDSTPISQTTQIYLSELYGESQNFTRIEYDRTPNSEHAYYYKDTTLIKSIKRSYIDGVLVVREIFDSKYRMIKFEQYHQNGQTFIKAETFGIGIHKIYDSLGNLKYEIMFKDRVPVDTIRKTL